MFVVFDLSNPSSWEHTLEFAKDIQVYYSRFSVICVGTKLDVAHPDADIYSAASALQKLLSLPVIPKIVCCSAKDPESVEQSFKNVLLSANVSYSDACNSSQVPLGRVRCDSDAFNTWLWTGCDPGAGIVRRFLDRPSKLIASLVEQMNHPIPTPEYFMRPKCK